MRKKYLGWHRKIQGVPILGTICGLIVLTVIIGLAGVLPELQETPTEPMEPPELRSQPLEPPESLVQTELEYTDTLSHVGINTKEPVESQQPAPSTQAPALQDVEHYPIMGRLTIEALKLDMPVLAEFSYDGLKIGPCLYAGPSSPIHAGNIVIVGHNYKKHFGPLQKLEAGQIVKLRDTSGMSYEYEVYELMTIAPHQVEALGEYEGDRALSLLTCTDKGKNRLLIRCRPIV